MKKTLYLMLAISFLLALTGCTDIDNTKTPVIETIDFEGNTQDTVGVGQSCRNIRCHAGLECDITFTCVNHVVDPNMVCPETQKPVCAQRDGRKNGYLNVCQAERHGAEVLYDGFCKPDATVKGNCEAPLISIGNCTDKVFEGYEFANGSCVKKSVPGCDADIPFETLEACESACK